MRAETLTLTITIRPSYGDAASVRQEIEDNLSWLADDHDGVRLDWGDVGEGVWPDDDEDEDG